MAQTNIVMRTKFRFRHDKRFDQTPPDCSRNGSVVKEYASIIFMVCGTGGGGMVGCVGAGGRGGGSMVGCVGTGADSGSGRGGGADLGLVFDITNCAACGCSFADVSIRAFFGSGLIPGRA